MSDRIDTSGLVKALWLLVWGIAFSLFIAYGSNSYDDGFSGSSLLAAAMVLLSFPFSMVFFALAGFLMETYVCYQCDPLVDIYISLGLFVSGYLQWFVVVKWWLRKPQRTTLNLTTATKTVPEALEAPLQSSRPPELCPPSAVYEPPFLCHDEGGLTPLERVLRDTPA